MLICVKKFKQASSCWAAVATADLAGCSFLSGEQLNRSLLFLLLLIFPIYTILYLLMKNQKTNIEFSFI